MLWSRRGDGIEYEMRWRRWDGDGAGRWRWGWGWGWIKLNFEWVRVGRGHLDIEDKCCLSNQDGRLGSKAIHTTGIHMPFKAMCYGLSLTPKMYGGDGDGVSGGDRGSRIRCGRGWIEDGVGVDEGTGWQGWGWRWEW